MRLKVFTEKAKSHEPVSRAGRICVMVVHAADAVVGNLQFSRKLKLRLSESRTLWHGIIQPDKARPP